MYMDTQEVRERLGDEQAERFFTWAGTSVLIAGVLCYSSVRVQDFVNNVLSKGV